MTSNIKCLVTGAGGFLGQAFAVSLLDDPSLAHLILTDVVEPNVPPGASRSRAQVTSTKADLTSLETCKSLFTPDINFVYLFHGIMSGAAEADFELGMRVNIDSTRQILDILREVNPNAKVIYTSSTAVYGPPKTPTTVINEEDAPNPGSSYGAQKHICETLLNDYSRRGLLDGRVCRLPTVGLPVQNSIHEVTGADFCFLGHRPPWKAHWSCLFFRIRYVPGAFERRKVRLAGLEGS